ncbi:MAG TPA: LON peptidase substrate-binding domain-containing protein, partial [Acidimicrobiia bacterium]
MVLPLRLFEPRYLQLYADVIDTTREFGVVLIERGIESRDDAATFDVGCVASIVGSGVNEDGTIGLITVGRRRIHVDEWLEPDPYPRAMVTELDDEPLSDEGLNAVRNAADRIPDLLLTAAELNPEVNTEVPELADDPGLAMYQIAQLSGLQALDLQEVLESPTTDSRARLVKSKVDETMELIRLQLEVGDR